jgi:hypothetical protein
MDNFIKQYKHKETWSRKGENFLIEVVRWETMTKEVYEQLKKEHSIDTGRFVWNVYCYLYKDHPKFNDSNTEDIFDCPVQNLNCGCTYVNWARNSDGEVVCKQYGSDYQHIWDDGFDKIEDPEDAYKVFNDAEDLFKELESKDG